jgi:hypothetical protein
MEMSRANAIPKHIIMVIIVFYEMGVESATERVG